MKYITMTKGHDLKLIADSFTAPDEVRELLMQGWERSADVEADTEEEARGNFNRSDFAKLKPKKCITSSVSETKYETAKTVAGVMTFIGWLTVILSVCSGLLMLASVRFMNFEIFITNGASVIGGVLAGLITVAVAQVVSATVDNADYSRQILEHLTK